MNKYFLTIVMSVAVSTLFSQSLELTLLDVIDLAKQNATASKAADTRKETRYWEYRTFKANYNPTLSLTGNLPGYNRDYFSNTQDDGTIKYQSRKQVSSRVNLGLMQPIALTGGRISVNSSLNQFGNLVSDNFQDQYRSTLVNVSLYQPIFGFNGLKWDQRTEPLRYEESKRSYVEEMESISQQVTRRYFIYLDAQIRLQISELNRENNDTNYKIQEGRYNLGKVSKDQLLEVELQVLLSERGVTQAKLDIQASKLALLSYIGMKQDAYVSLELKAPDELPTFEIPLETALTYARNNRSDFVQFERRRIEAERNVDQARKQRFETNLNASVGYNQAAGNLEQAYIDPNGEQIVNLSLSMPILDWGRTKAKYHTAMANQKLTEYTLDQEIQNFEQEVIALVGRFEVLRANVVISKRSDEVAKERYDVTQNRYLIGKASILELNTAQNQKDEAKKNYITSLSQFWSAYFDLRRLTLYDFLNEELLYRGE
jgi:outer membrane protein TolC